ncbi:hypothetical protein [Pajaroellobacter abortibovis]|uniref:Uncharacterized protein n=1 Tax=Pajaroellobacter abortibovis TaxID=1882918 RepID=A0A1L6MV33_9BACT|nr:hypothetical protein [Pajaroellobacter abortibovis]APR99317.1 hypothetical protein BCY86_00475 [Pajaroellobacter abortibovis]
MDANPPPPILAPAPQPACSTLGNTNPNSDPRCALYERSNSTDFLYLAGGVGLTTATISADVLGWSRSPSPAIRFWGPPMIGLSWGFLLGSIYPALPHSPSPWIPSALAEERKHIPTYIAASVALLAGITSPFVVAIETGPPPTSWSHSERQLRIVTSALTGAAGALLPYLFPPVPWKALRQLERLRLQGESTSFFLTYQSSF